MLILKYPVKFIFHSPQSLLVLRWSQSPGRCMIRWVNFKVSDYFVKSSVDSKTESGLTPPLIILAYVPHQEPSTVRFWCCIELSLIYQKPDLPSQWFGQTFGSLKASLRFLALLHIISYEISSCPSLKNSEKEVGDVMPSQKFLIVLQSRTIHLKPIH